MNVDTPCQRFIKKQQEQKKRRLTRVWKIKFRKEKIPGMLNNDQP